MQTTETDIIQETQQKIFNRHGGLDNWKKIECIRLKMVAMHGLIPFFKGLDKTFHLFQEITVYPHQKKVVFHNYPYQDEQTIYFYGNMIQSARGGSIEGRIDRYREKFSGFDKNYFWNPMDAAYFFGYAILHEISLPFALQKYEIEELFIDKDGDWQYRFNASFSASAEVHSQRESFFFDASGLLFRHDYTTTIIHSLTGNSHFFSNYWQNADILIALDWQVRIKLAAFILPFSTLEVKFSPIEII